MFKQEQERIDGEVGCAESQLSLAGIKLESARELIRNCLELLSSCFRSYKARRRARSKEMESGGLQGRVRQRKRNRRR